MRAATGILAGILAGIDAGRICVEVRWRSFHPVRSQ